MENVTVKTIEMKEYTAADGFVFKKTTSHFNEKGETVETPSFARKLFGHGIVIEEYDVVPESEMIEYQEAQTPPM